MGGGGERYNEYEVVERDNFGIIKITSCTWRGDRRSNDSKRTNSK